MSRKKITWSRDSVTETHTHTHTHTHKQAGRCIQNLHSWQNVCSFYCITITDQEGTILTALHEVLLSLHPTDVLVVPYAVGRRHLSSLMVLTAESWKKNGGGPLQKTKEMLLPKGYETECMPRLANSFLWLVWLWYEAKSLRPLDAFTNLVWPISKRCGQCSFSSSSYAHFYWSCLLYRMFTKHTCPRCDHKQSSLVVLEQRW